MSIKPRGGETSLLILEKEDKCLMKTMPTCPDPTATASEILGAKEVP